MKIKIENNLVFYIFHHIFKNLLVLKRFIFFHYMYKYETSTNIFNLNFQIIITIDNICFTGSLH